MTGEAAKPDFGDLVEAHGREIHAYVWRMVRDEAEAEDVLQSAFLRAYRAYGRLPAGANYRAWLYRIAGNQARTLLRRRAQQPLRLTDELPAQGAGVERQAELRIRLQQVAQAVQQLPDKQRASLVLHRYQGLSYAEIAEVLDISPEAARANLYQALRKLRRQFPAAAHAEPGRRVGAAAETGVR